MTSIKSRTNKARTAIAVLAAALSLTTAAVAPAVSQAQWHTIVVGGHVFTHGNFKESGVTPCQRIEGELHKAEGEVGKDPDAEGEVVRTSGEAFEYGCDPVVGAAKPAPGKPSRPSHVAGSAGLAARG
jgi:hypothetical protein